MKAKNLQQIIIGTHSVKAALENPKRKCLDFFATAEGLKTFLKNNKISKQDIQNKVGRIVTLDPHQFQQTAQNLFKDLGFEFQRLTSGVFLLAQTLPEISWQDLNKITKEKIILALDQVTDVHNAAAIIRTCAFYGVGAVIIETKGSFNLTPSLTRIASGGIEAVPIFSTTNLSAALRNLKETGVKVIGLSEEAQNSSLDSVEKTPVKTCLVFGSEDRGLSNAVERELTDHISIPSAIGSNISSLNVSVAVAVTLERLR